MKQKLGWVHFSCSVVVNILTLSRNTCLATKGSVGVETQFQQKYFEPFTIFFVPSDENFPYQPMHVNKKCVEDSNAIVEAISNQLEWALSSTFFL